MNKLKAIMASVVVAGAAMAGILAANVASAQAANAPLCTLPGLPLNQYGGKNFTVSGDKISVRVTLTGEASCKYDLTLATFKGYEKVDTPNGIFFDYEIPRDAQDLYSFTTKNYYGSRHLHSRDCDARLSISGRRYYG